MPRTENGLSAQVQKTTINQLECLRISNANASATIVLQGAHIIDYAPTGGKNALFTSAAEPFIAGEAIRGGIPICWPWFGPHSRCADAPAHGLVRTAEWGYDILSETQGQTELLFYYELDGSDPAFPHRVRAELLVAIGASLELRLSTTNLGEERVQLSQALHSYFNCDDIQDVRIEGLSGARYLDQLDGAFHLFPQDFSFNTETDWIVQDQGQAIRLSGCGEGDIELEREGSQSVIVWNPWQDKAARLSHFLPEEYRHMFCVETANAAEDTREIAPGGRHTLALRINRAT